MNIRGWDKTKFYFMERTEWILLWKYSINPALGCGFVGYKDSKDKKDRSWIENFRTVGRKGYRWKQL